MQLNENNFRFFWGGGLALDPPDPRFGDSIFCSRPELLSKWTDTSLFSSRYEMSNTRLFKNRTLLTLALCRSSAPPIWASIRWSQWMVEGTATLGRPLLMNWSIAIWAVASCIATRSGRRRRYVRPRSISCPAGSSRWPYTIFSDRVRGLPSLAGRSGGKGNVVLDTECFLTDKPYLPLMLLCPVHNSLFWNSTIRFCKQYLLCWAGCRELRKTLNYT